jgi:hypothetical protein
MSILKRHGEPEDMVGGVQVTVPENAGLSRAEQIADSVKKRVMSLTITRNCFPETPVQHIAS